MEYKYVFIEYAYIKDIYCDIYYKPHRARGGVDLFSETAAYNCIYVS